MKFTQSQSALEASAVYLRGLWAVMWLGFGRFGAELDPWRAVDDWINGVFRRLDVMLAQFQAGQIAARDVQHDSAATIAPSRVPIADGRAKLGGLAHSVAAGRTDAAPEVEDDTLGLTEPVMRNRQPQNIVRYSPILCLLVQGSLILPTLTSFLAKMAWANRQLLVLNVPVCY
jgi:hypothetical protein